MASVAQLDGRMGVDLVVSAYGVELLVHCAGNQGKFGQEIVQRTSFDAWQIIRMKRHGGEDVSANLFVRRPQVGIPHAVPAQLFQCAGDLQG